MRLTDLFQHRLVHADGWVKAVNGTRSAVELIRNRIELILAEGRQINALGQILPNQTVDVLTTAPLPRAMRVTEVHLNPSVGCQLRMSGHLFALVIGQCSLPWS